MAPAPMTAQEILASDAWKKATFSVDIQPTESGQVAVAKGRGGPIQIAWETHGHGPIHLVLIMGLGAFKSSWHPFCKHYGHERADRYTVLVFDNRGMGQSGKPLMRYSTSEMAKDLLELLDDRAWTADRDLHVAGISMGGAIAQELAYAVPHRIASLTLMSTFPRLVRSTNFVQNLRNRINMFVPRDIDTQIAMVKHQIWSDGWLAQPDGQLGLFPTNGDWFAAAELTKRMDKTGAFTRTGFICQAIAAGWHHKSDAQLKEIADRVGRDRIWILVGDQDRMVTPMHAELLLAGFGGEENGVTITRFKGVSHVPIVERRQDVYDLQEKFIEKTVKLGKKTST